MFIATIPAVIWVDKVGRKPVLISGAFLMAAQVSTKSLQPSFSELMYAQVPSHCRRAYWSVRRLLGQVSRFTFFAMISPETLRRSPVAIVVR